MFWGGGVDNYMTETLLSFVCVCGGSCLLIEKKNKGQRKLSLINPTN